MWDKQATNKRGGYYYELLDGIYAVLFLIAYNLEAVRSLSQFPHYTHTCARVHRHTHSYTICRQGNALDSLSGQEFTGPWTSEMHHRYCIKRVNPSATKQDKSWVHCQANRESISTQKVLHFCTTPKIPRRLSH